ncbi:hypothetical protein EVAR_76724_1 [Eumeta japonica]|uniref:Uncharacterized protein n=1 Tax=Eumeta variegata TaxID=151549 RepID=A0A4C1STL0_EUMVA|nr:hypothetical protein EVAR_76724_1 [Eumeta japonica]
MRIAHNSKKFQRHNLLEILLRLVNSPRYREVADKRARSSCKSYSFALEGPVRRRDGPPAIAQCPTYAQKAGRIRLLIRAYDRHEIRYRLFDRRVGIRERTGTK